MPLEWRLHEVLKAAGLNYRGILAELQHDEVIHINRSTLSKIYNNKTTRVSLETIGRLCELLIKKGVDPAILPGALFGWRPSALWNVLAARGAAHIYLGECQRGEVGKPTFRFIARRDAHVANRIIEKLSDKSTVGNQISRVSTTYVPFHGFADQEFTADKTFHYDVERAARLFREMQHSAGHFASVLIGSQHVNYLVEHYVASLFGCKAFQPDIDDQSVQIFRGYRAGDPDVPSCFGGRTLPGSRRAAEAGIYYRTDADDWKLVPWRAGRDDAAIISTSYDSSNSAFTLLILGYSGRATAAAGNYLALHPDKFWQRPVGGSRSIETRMRICRIEFAEQVSDDQDDDPRLADFEIVHTISLNKGGRQRGAQPVNGATHSSAKLRPQPLTSMAE